jgi:hypothetical protein
MYALAYPSSARKKSDREQDGLRGSVRSVRVESASVSRIAGLFTRERRRLIRIADYDIDGNKIKQINYNSGGRDKQTEIYSHDSEGRKTEWVVKQEDVVIRTVYRYYDSQVEAVEQVMGGSTIIRKYRNTFDASGNQTEASYSDDRGTYIKAHYTYNFDDQGCITTVATSNTDGYVYHKIVYRYDSDGNIIMEAAHRSDGTLYKKSVFSYSSNGRVRKDYTYKEDGSLEIKLVSTYNDRGDVIEVICYGADGKHKGGKTVRKYEYDSMDNWIKQTTESLDALTGEITATWIEYRDISYY